jgi:TolB-like protein
MNARLNFAENDCSSGLVAHSARQALQRLVVSPSFCKAPRMCKLLTFLVENKISGKESEISEYLIGVKVFQRDAQLYQTDVDPVVRVQVGRLRNRLVAHYAAANDAMEHVQITIPMGSYVPQIAQLASSVDAPAPRYRLELSPLRNLSSDHEGQMFVAGLDEELGCRLYQAFGSLILPVGHAQAMWSGRGGDAGASHRLEGSVRVEKGRVRASVRLIDTRGGQITWLSQFDSALCIHLQEEMASAICEKLARHFN